MHKYLGFFALSATFTSAISNPDASIFALDSSANAGGSEIPFLSNDTAQRLLNYRMRSSTTTDLMTADRDIVEILDRYGGMQPSLFGISSDDQDLRSSLILLHGLDPVIESSIQKEYKQGLVHCDSRATFLHNNPLNWNIDGESEDDAGTADGHCLKYLDSEQRKRENVQTLLSCLPNASAFKPVAHALGQQLPEYVNIMESWVNDQEPLILRLSFKSFSGSVHDTVLLGLLRSLMSDLHSLSLDGTAVTVIFMPDSQDSRMPQNPSRRGNHEAKTLQMDMASPSLLRRQSPGSTSPNPTCHVTNSSCNEATSGCSGHGSCYRKSESKSGLTNNDCFVCKCHATTIRQDDGTTRIIRWGGAACEKQDISSPFFLLATASIMVIIALGGAIGMLFRVGQDDLPGVISAGVGPTKAQG
ncbi:DUF3844 domain-containing protein [Aspergillus novofumigatus IBT 16806]|uniref:Vacuolar sorting protein Vps3844 C-terminal domain-containing protein n=1 Tax=Aspergillus novofumigatus (strain IBT 16806) TaxID=1392255 RepID=A0A2I1BZS9_ASPN1|nr:uncharacterized protein P174DRAFT_463054 [Aspergillus novofumigatus IBT 16806]PKX90890.1 hypothetical protein P174DRAFT_463054 [Aspergillus novofumigatus IBT 16806]